MARQRRLNLPGAIYHLITRGLNKTALFKDNHDRDEFLRRLEKALAQTGCQCFAWVLMTNHIHLLVRSSEKALSQFARKLLTGYAIYFNHRHKRTGYLYQNRYKSILCQAEPYLLELVRYIHLNPVRTKIIKTLKELDDYPWGGHSALVGRRRHSWQARDEILGHFGKTKGCAIKAYRKFVEDGWQIGRRGELTGGSLKRKGGFWDSPGEARKNGEYWRGDELILGDDEFVKQALKRAEEEVLKREKLKRAGWGIERAAGAICRNLEIDLDTLRRRGRGNMPTTARALLAFWGYNMLGLSGIDIARYLNVSRPAVGYLMKIGARVAKERGLSLII